LTTGSEFPAATPIWAHDPDFNEFAFVSFARDVSIRVLKARHAGNLGALQRVLAPAYFDRLQADRGPRRHWEAILPILQAGATADPAAMMQAMAPTWIDRLRAAGDMIIISAYLVQAETLGDWDTAVVRITASPPPPDNVFSVTFDDVFKRPSTATSRAEDDQQCQVCGAPLALDEAGMCRYCGAPAAGGIGGWQLADEDDGVTAESPAALRTAALAPIEAHDPGFKEQAFVPFAVAVSQRVATASTTGNLADVRRLLSPTYFQELQDAKDRPRLMNMTIVSADLVRADTRGRWDTAVVHITAYPRVPRPPYTLAFDSSFQRPATATSRAEDQRECPICGAPLSFADQGACTHCGSAVAGGMGGWQLVDTNFGVSPAKIAVKRWFYCGQTAEQITALLGENQARLTQIRVEDASVPTFAVAMIENIGAYASPWWWFSGADADTVSGMLEDDRRPISIDPYWTSAGLRFAGISVANTGEQSLGWQLHYGIEAEKLVEQTSTELRRLVALRPYLDGGQRVFAAIVVDNVPGRDYSHWAWWYEVSPDSIASKVTELGFGSQMRVTCLAPDPLGGWDVVMVLRKGEGWWCSYALDSTEVQNILDAHTSRLIDLSPSLDNGVWRYAIVELDGSLPAQAGLEA
jgi:hypothetical protein